MDLIESLHQKLNRILLLDPLSYLRLMDKYDISTITCEDETVFIIKYRNLNRVHVYNIYKHVYGFSKNIYTVWSISDGLDSFRYDIRKENDHYWFAVADYNITSEIELMIRIFRELHLCTITKSNNNYVHFNFWPPKT